MPQIKVRLGEPTYYSPDKIEDKIKNRPHNVFDFSMISTFLECPTKYYLRYEEDLVPVGPPPIPLLFGSAIHNSLAVHYNLLKDERKIKDGHLDLLRRAFISEISDEIRAGTFPVEPEDSKDGKRHVMKGYEVLEDYISFYGADLHWKIADVEQPFAIIIPYDTDSRDSNNNKDEGEIIYVGRRDLEAVNSRDEYMVIDHKTTSVMNKSINKHAINMQITGYLQSVRELKGIDARKAIINLMGIYKGASKFERHNFTRTPQQFEIFREQIKNITSHILQSRHRVKNGEDYESIFWQNSESCFNWGRECSFYCLCTAHSLSSKKNLVESAFRRETWTPYDIVED